MRKYKLGKSGLVTGILAISALLLTNQISSSIKEDPTVPHQQPSVSSQLIDQSAQHGIPSIQIDSEPIIAVVVNKRRNDLSSKSPASRALEALAWRSPTTVSTERSTTSTSKEEATTTSESSTTTEIPTSTTTSTLRSTFAPSSPPIPTSPTITKPTEDSLPAPTVATTETTISSTTQEPTTEAATTTTTTTQPTTTTSATTTTTQPTTTITQATTTTTTTTPQATTTAQPTTTAATTTTTTAAPPTTTAPTTTTTTKAAPPPIVSGPQPLNGSTPSNSLGFAGTYKKWTAYPNGFDGAGIQKKIDSGAIAVPYRAPNVRDGRSSYVLGHNPGVMSYVAGLKVGDVVRLSDSTHYRDYRVQQTISGAVNYFHEMGNLGKYSAYDYADEPGVNEEHLVIQFCIGGANRLYLAVPI